MEDEGESREHHAYGEGIEARFNAPYGIAVDKDGIIYVSDSHNNAIRKIVAGTQLRGALVTTLVGQREEGFADGIGAAARLYRPSGIAVDIRKTILVADSHNHRIRKIEAAAGGDGGAARRDGWRLTTVAGSSQRGHDDGVGALPFAPRPNPPFSPPPLQ